MKYTITNITSTTSLRKMVKDVGPDDFMAFVENILTISSEVEEQIKQRDQELDERKKKLQDYYEQMQNDGLDDGRDLKTFIDSYLHPSEDKLTKNNKPPKIAKYAYKDENGIDKTWSGHGRMPAAMQNEINNKTKAKEDFLIKCD